MYTIKSILVITFLALFLNSCKQTGCTDPTAVNYDPEATESSNDCTFPFLTFDISPTVNGEALKLGNVYTINGKRVEINIAQFYISSIKVGTNGNFDESDTYLLVKGDQNLYEIGKITAGNKQALTFDVGVDQEANHADPTTYPAEHPLAFQVPSMHWSWDNGYQFIKMEGKVDLDGNDAPETPFEYHIGKDSNLQSIALEINQDMNAENVQINLKVDFAKFFDGVDLSNELVTHTGDGPILAEKIALNAQKAFSVL